MAEFVMKVEGFDFRTEFGKYFSELFRGPSTVFLEQKWPKREAFRSLLPDIPIIFSHGYQKIFIMTLE